MHAGLRTVDRKRSFLCLLCAVAVIAAGFVIGLETPATAAQQFDNARVADAGLAEVGTARATGYDQPGECIKSAQRWVRAAGGTFLGGGTVSSYQRSGAQEVPLNAAVKGDVIQYSNSNDQDWAGVHTVVVVRNHGNGYFDIVQSNVPLGSGLVTRNTNWRPTPPSGKVARAWRFGQVAPAGSAAPFGAFDEALRADNGIRVRGWAIDPDTNNPIQAHVYVDGARYAHVANAYRPDVDRVHRRGVNHGFDVVVPVGPGTHTVCVYGINVGGGNNSRLGCKYYTTPPGVPFGVFDEASRTGNGIRVRGWAIDPDTNNPIQVHVYVDRAGHARVANAYRPDVDRVHRRGVNHGFDVVVPAGPGTHTVCAYGINFGGGTNRQLGCKSIRI